MEECKPEIAFFTRVEITREYELADPAMGIGFPTLRTSPDCGISSFNFIASSLQVIKIPAVGVPIESLVSANADKESLIIHKTEKLALWKQTVVVRLTVTLDGGAQASL